MSARYVVRELEGWASARTGGAGTSPGLSCIVLDTALNYRLVEEFRTEDVYRNFAQWMRRAEIRRRAAALADRLNAAA